MNMSVLEEDIPKKKRFHWLLKYFEPKQNKIEKNLLQTASRSTFKGLKQIIHTFYLFYGEVIINYLILVSIIDQVAVVFLTDKLIIDIGVLPQIDIIFTLEILVNFFMATDFCIKILLHEYFMDSNCYGFEYLILDCLAGPIIFLYDFFHIIYFKKFTFLGFLLRSLKCFTLGFIRKILHKLRKIFPKISPLLWGLFVFFYIFTYYAKALYCEELPMYFSTLTDSMFTMFQFITLDSWGVLGRVVLDEQGIFSAYYMAFFIFIMTYFFLNILLGFLVDNMSPESKEFPQTIILQKEIPDEDDRKIVNIWRKMAFGDFTDKIIFITFLLSWIEIHTFVNQNDFLGDIAIFFELTMDFIYIMNFYLWVVSYSFFQNKPYVYVYIFVIKLLAGPLAFGLDFSYFMSSQAYFIGHYFRILQILSTKILNDFVFLYFPILPKIGYPFLALIGMISFMACWTTERLGAALPDFFSNFNLSIFSFIQMLSLDEWCNTVTRGILMNASESALVFVLFIFVANYILLNVMLAIACSEIKKKDSTNEISPKASNEQTIQKNALSTVLKKLMILISFHHKFLFKTIENNYKFDFLKKQKKIQIFEQEDIENYYLIKELIKNSSNNNNTCTIAYKGRTLKLNSFHFLAINKNLEILAEKKINKSQIFIEFDTGSYFEMEGPAMITKKTSYISIFMELFFKKLLSFRSKNKDFENLSDKNIKC